LGLFPPEQSPTDEQVQFTGELISGGPVTQTGFVLSILSSSSDGTDLTINNADFILQSEFFEDPLFRTTETLNLGEWWVRSFALNDTGYGYSDPSEFSVLSRDGLSMKTPFAGDIPVPPPVSLGGRWISTGIQIEITTAGFGIRNVTLNQPFQKINISYNYSGNDLEDSFSRTNVQLGYPLSSGNQYRYYPYIILSGGRLQYGPIRSFIIA
jgi:hypothetical protein